MNETREVWLRGPVPEIPQLLQPVAHALLQATEEIENAIASFNTIYLWDKPYGMASVGFHLQHLSGVLDRLFTYARGESLSTLQLKALQQEGSAPAPSTTATELVTVFREQVQRALIQLQETDEKRLTEHRAVGRQQLSSTVLGLLFHAAEHTQRHVGQLLVTAKAVSQQQL
jgi:uncharacterized damage-inducible protein DinB